MGSAVVSIGFPFRSRRSPSAWENSGGRSAPRWVACRPTNGRRSPDSVQSISRGRSLPQRHVSDRLARHIVAPIQLDPESMQRLLLRRGGPLDGLEAAPGLVALQADRWDGSRGTFGRAPAEAGRPRLRRSPNGFGIEASLQQSAAARACRGQRRSLSLGMQGRPARWVRPAADVEVPRFLLSAETISSSKSMRQEAIAKHGRSRHVGRGAPTLGLNGHLDAFARIAGRAGKIIHVLAKWRRSIPRWNSTLSCSALMFPRGSIFAFVLVAGNTVSNRVRRRARSPRAPAWSGAP